MFKKLAVFIFVFAFSLSVLASEIKDIPYKNLKDGQKINITEGQGWTDKVRRRDSGWFIKRGSELFSNDEALSFDTGCDYIFINKGNLYGYSENDLKFYEISYTGGKFFRTESDFDEVSTLFKDFRVISISDFTVSTNVFKFKKTRGEEKIMLLNDTNIDFSNYVFTTNKAQFSNYAINNAIGITKGGLIQFSKDGEDAKDSPWFILLVR